MRVLNLYAGIGGNRKLWPEDIEVTAVERDRKIAGVYQGLYPKDRVLICDAHDYHSQTTNSMTSSGLARHARLILG